MNNYLEHFGLLAGPFFATCFFIVLCCIVGAIIIDVADRFQNMRLKPTTAEKERLAMEVELLRLRAAVKVEALQAGREHAPSGDAPADEPREALCARNS